MSGSNPDTVILIRQVLSFQNVYTMQKPEAYLGNITEALDDAGRVVSERTQTFLKDYMDNFIQWINRF